VPGKGDRRRGMASFFASCGRGRVERSDHGRRLEERSIRVLIPKKDILDVYLQRSEHARGGPTGSRGGLLGTRNHCRWFQNRIWDQSSCEGSGIVKRRGTEGMVKRSVRFLMKIYLGSPLALARGREPESGGRGESAWSPIYLNQLFQEEAFFWTGEGPFGDRPRSRSYGTWARDREGEEIHHPRDRRPQSNAFELIVFCARVANRREGGKRGIRQGEEPHA